MATTMQQPVVEYEPQEESSNAVNNNDAAASEISPLEFSVPQFAADSITTGIHLNDPRSTNVKEIKVDDRPSFTADSPYFGGFCENEVKSFQILSESLGEISKRTVTFAKTGALMSEATRRLVLSCRLQRLLPDDANEEMHIAEEEAMMQRRQVLGDEMTELLGLLADVLEEVSAAQLNMCNSLEATLGTALATFAHQELSTIAIMKKETDEATNSAENLFSKYLVAPKRQSDDNDNMQRIGGKQNLASRVSSWGKKTLGSEISGRVARTKSGVDGPETNTHDIILAKAMTAATIKANIEQIRLAQAAAELKRFQLVKRLINAKYRRNFEVGEDVMATFHALNAYYHQCSDLVAGYIPSINRIQQKQNETHSRHTNFNQPYWNEHEKMLENNCVKIQENLADSVRIADKIGDGDPFLIDQQLLTRDELEESANIWLLPKQLAFSSGCKREPTPGVLIEGWLYKKSNAVISLNPWSRRWFVMDKKAIYYYRTDAETRRSNNGNNADSYSERVKVTDVVLCTVREIPSDGGGNRFCFQLVNPNDPKPLTLQARGPMEYKMWVDGIRDNTTRQLVHGDHTNDFPTRDRRTFSDFDGKDSDNDFEASMTDMDGNYRAPNEKNPIVQEVMDANPTCADCGMPEPDWVSLNLGVLMCIECSAVHRSMGVHVSKVRSLKLDALAAGEYRLLLSLGNEKMNGIYECGVNSQKGWKKPTSRADRKERDTWIKSKYMWRGFLDVGEKEDLEEKDRVEKRSKELFEAAKKGDLDGVVTAFVHGGSVDYVNPNEDHKTALHICALCKQQDCEGPWKAIEIAEFLIQNGSKVDTLDGFQHGVLDSALLGNADVAMVEYLTSKLS